MNFISKDFHLHYIASYTLYIQSDFKHDYLVVVSEDNEVLVFLYYDNDAPTIEATRILSLPFQHIIVGMRHQNLIWVPLEVFNISEKHLYTSYFLNENVEDILHKEVENVKAVALFQYDKLIASKWHKVFPEAKLIPMFEILMTQTMEHKPVEGNLLTVHLYDGMADILLFVNGEFKLYNTFEVQTVDDLSYFVLAIMKNFSLGGKIERIVLSAVDKESEYAVRLANYTDDLMILESKNKWTSENNALQQAIIPLNLLADSVLCV